MEGERACARVRHPNCLQPSLAYAMKAAAHPCAWRKASCRLAGKTSARTDRVPAAGPLSLSVAAICKFLDPFGARFPAL
eukprot:6177560-Pleurochrysis_carterae.AAC.1